MVIILKRIDSKLNKQEKILIIYFVSIGIGIISTTLYHNLLAENVITQSEDHVIGINLVRVIDVDNKNLFETMADMENYPKILPTNVISVKIINQTEGKISTIFFTEEKIVKSDVTTTLIVKHNLVPYDLHVIEVMSGDAKGTIIRETYKEMDSGTELTTDVQIHVKGTFAPFGRLTTPQLERIVNTTIDKFVEYAKNKE